MSNSVSTRTKRPRLESESSGAPTVSLQTGCLPFIDRPILQDKVQTPVIPDPNPECAGKDQGNDETLRPGNQPQDMPTPSGAAIHTDEIEQMVITSMKFISLRSLQRWLMTRQAFERRISLWALDEFPLAFTPWCTTVALNGEPNLSVPP